MPRPYGFELLLLLVLQLDPAGLQGAVPFAELLRLCNGTGGEAGVRYSVRSRSEKKGSPDSGSLQFENQAVPLVLHSQFPILLLVPDSLDLVQEGRIERESVENRQRFLERVFREVSSSTRLRGRGSVRRGRLRVLCAWECAQRRQEGFEVALRGDGRRCWWWGNLRWRGWGWCRSWSCRGILGLPQRS